MTRCCVWLQLCDQQKTRKSSIQNSILCHPFPAYHRFAYLDSFAYTYRLELFTMPSAAEESSFSQGQNTQQASQLNHSPTHAAASTVPPLPASDALLNDPREWYRQVQEHLRALPLPFKSREKLGQKEVQRWKSLADVQVKSFRALAKAHRPSHVDQLNRMSKEELFLVDFPIISAIMAMDENARPDDPGDWTQLEEYRMLHAMRRPHESDMVADMSYSELAQCQDSKWNS
jgi:hypothetical protein